MMQARNSRNIPIIDVSKHQGTIDWKAVASASIKGVMVKASEGVGYTDPRLLSNAAGASAEGLAVGLYHYCRPETGNTAQSEAKAFLTAITGLPAELPYVLDVEGEAAGLESGTLTNWCREWLETVESRTGHSVMIYTGASFARTQLGGELGRWPLWIAHYGVNQPLDNGIWNRWAMFQYSETGTVSGIAGNVDMNEMDIDYWNEITAVSGKLKVEDEENMPMRFENDWQWKMLGDALDGLYRKGLLSDYKWAEKAYSRKLTDSEAAWLSMMILARQQDITV